MNYENLLSMCSKSQRRNHKLVEWREDFITWARSLPYAQDFIFIDRDINGDGIIMEEDSRRIRAWGEAGRRFFSIIVIMREEEEEA